MFGTSWKCSVQSAENKINEVLVFCERWTYPVEDLSVLLLSEDFDVGGDVGTFCLKNEKKLVSWKWY